MPDESTHWPVLGEVDGVDPYPFHGLAVLYEGQPDFRLRPHDGRPEIPLPSRTVNGSSRYRGAPYVPSESGVLWDIGRPDPPVTPLIYAAGGTAWGRRIVSPETNPMIPARLGDQTRRINIYISPFYAQVTSVGQLLMNVDGVISVAGTINLATDFGAAPSQIYREGTSTTIEQPGNPVAWQCQSRMLDASPDGCRRLLALSLSGVGDGNSAVVGIFEVVISLDGDAVTVAIQVLKTAADCLGVYSVTGSNDRYYEISEFYGSVDEGEICGTSYS